MTNYYVVYLFFFFEKIDFSTIDVIGFAFTKMLVLHTLLPLLHALLYSVLCSSVLILCSVIVMLSIMFKSAD